MNDYFLLEQILFEGKVEEIKKKYANIDPEVIDYLSGVDPSKNNKYLEFLVKNWAKSSTFNDKLVNTVVNFHKNLTKIDEDLLKKLFDENKLTHYLDDSETSPVGITVKKINKAPKDISSYMGVAGVGIMEAINELAKYKLSKSEVKKLEANILYEDSDLKILIPESYRASCYYGAGTKWCTASKESDSHFNRYTKTGTLFYIIDKKSPSSNNWYRTAIFVNKNDGTAQAFDAPDTPTKINKAAAELGDKWPIIRDTIVDYLYKINSKGIDFFYYGNELLTFYRSKGIDPLKVLSPSMLIEKIGLDVLLSYLKEEGINIYTYFDFDELMIINTNGKGNDVNFDEEVAKIWNGYVENDINPLTRMFNVRRRAILVVDAVANGYISLDSFLYLLNDSVFLASFGEDQNLFSIISQLFSGSSFGKGTYEPLMKLFNNDINLLWGYINSFNINIFTDLDPRGAGNILAKKFTNIYERLDYVFKNIEKVNNPLNLMNFSNEDVLSYLKSKNKLNLVEDLLERNILKNLKIEDYILLGYTTKESFLKFFDDKVYDSSDAEYYVRELLSNKEVIKKMFSSQKQFKDFLESEVPYGDVISEDFVSDTKLMLNAFYNDDFYSMYLYYLKENKLSYLSFLFLLNAYKDSPVDDNTGLKKRIVEGIKNSYDRKKKSTYLEQRGNDFYIIVKFLTSLNSLFDNDNNSFAILADDTNWIKRRELNNINFDSLYNSFYDKEVRNAINDILMMYRNKRIVMDMEFVDDFDYWVENINDENGTFYFTLYDERIYSLNPELLEILIKNAPILKNLKDVLEYSYKESTIEVFMNKSKEYLLTDIENVFGNGFYRIIREDDEKMSYEFKYDYLIEDAVNYAEQFVFDEDDIVISPIALIQESMEYNLGRFKNGYLSFDVYDIIDDIYDDENFKDYFLEKLDDVLKRVDL